MKAILCALDFSEASENIVKQAMDMAMQRGGGLIVLYAYRLIQPMEGSMVDYRNSMEERAGRNFEAIMNRIEMNGSVPYEFRTEIGFLSDRVEDFTKRNTVDLIVMGQNLARTINEHRGMTFEHFLDTVNLPVLVVPARKVVE